MINQLRYALLLHAGLVAAQPCPTAIDWQELRQHAITHPAAFCDGRTVSNTFDIRISSRQALTDAWSVDVTAPTIWLATGGISQDFVTDKCAAVGVRSMAENLWQSGARIVELRWHHALGPAPDERYRGTESCQHTALGEALNIMQQVSVADAPNERWWPTDAANRFGFGISQGQVLWQFAVDVAEDASSALNRVVLGGGGTVTDLYNRINCDSAANDGQKILDAIDFSFRRADNGQLPSCACNQTGSDPLCRDDTVDCSGDDDLIERLLSASSGSYIGQPDDASRAQHLLANTGFDLGCNQQANNDYIEQRQGNDSIWDFQSCLCGCAISGHGPINAFQQIFGHTTPWTDFFRSGKVTMDNIACPTNISCPAPPPVDNLTLSDCGQTLFSNDFENKPTFLH